MPPRLAPDLAVRRDQLVEAAWRIAEAEGWPAVTMRRLAGELGATQPVLYSAFPGRQALIDAVALKGFDVLADELESADRTVAARLHAYLEFAAAHPAVYDAMFSLPSGLPFDSGTQAPLTRAFEAIRAVVLGRDDTRAEVAWATLHGLATLQAGGRLPADRAAARLDEALRLLTR